MLQALLGFLKKIFFFTGYFTNSSYPKPLPPEKESYYLGKMLQGDNNAREKLIYHNMRLVAHVAKKYSNGNDTDDLISIGSIGLIKGLESYTTGKGTTLATYLARCIENEILMTLRSNKKYKNTVYLQEQLGTDNEGNDYTLMEILCDGEENVFKKVELSILRNNLLNTMRQHLSSRECDILTMRFGLQDNPPMTQLEVAEKLDISRSYVSRIETKALQKLRMLLKDSDML